MAPAPRPAPATANGEVSRPQQKILDVLATLERLGLAAAHRASVGAFSSYSSTSGNFQNLLGQLKSRGLVDYPSGGLVALTDAGRAIGQPSGTFRTLEDLHQAWFDQLGGPRTKLLRVLLECYPQPISREELGERTGYSPGSGNFQNLLGSMRTLSLIAYPTPGQVVATDLLFPAGLAPTSTRERAR